MQLHNVSDWNLLRPTDSTDSHSCSRPKYPRRNWPKEGSDHHSTPTRLLQLLMHPPPPNPLPWSLSEEVEEPLEGVNLFLAVAGVRLGKRGVRAAESWWESLQHYPWARPTLSCLVLPSALVCVCVLFGHDNDCGEHGERYSLWCREERSWPQSCQGARPRRGDLRRAEFLRCGLRQVGAGLLTAVLCSWVRSLLQIWLIQQVHCGLQVLASLLWAMTSFFFW